MTAPPLPVAAVVMTRNEARSIVGCLASLRGHFAQTFVVDSDSADGTAALAAASGATVVRFNWNGTYPKKKQWCLETLPLRVDWVLFVDADERLTPDFLDELTEAIAFDTGFGAYRIVARPTFAGRTLRFGRRHSKVALLHRRRAAYRPVDDLDVPSMWEVEGHYQPAVDGATGCLRSPIVHDDPRGLGNWIARHNMYSDWVARLEGRGRMPQVWATDAGAHGLAKRLSPRLPARPLLAFLDSYLFRMGFLDGRAGLHYALSRAFYFWMIDLKRAADDEARRR